MNIPRSQRTASSIASGKKAVQAKTASTSVGSVVPDKSKSRNKVVTQPSSEEVALRAYFIAEHRKSLGIHGDETSDWIAAERELLAELNTK